MQRRRWFLALIPIAAAAAVIRQRQHGASSLPPTLTGEIAKSALISLIESSKDGVLSSFPIEDWRSTNVVNEEDWMHWGPITLKLNERIYEFTTTAGPEARLCKMWYRGAFEFRDHNWVALSPEWYQTALMKGS